MGKINIKRNVVLVASVTAADDDDDCLETCLGIGYILNNPLSHISPLNL
jgi:hypothetical protein